MFRCLIISLLSLLALDAPADRIECACPAQIRLPARNAVNVPLNTKAWTLGPYFEDLSVRELPMLQAGQRFEDDDLHIGGTGVDQDLRNLDGRSAIRQRRRDIDQLMA